jgi:hypothetical protein
MDADRSKPVDDALDLNFGGAEVDEKANLESFGDFVQVHHTRNVCVAPLLFHARVDLRLSAVLLLGVPASEKERRQ